MYSIRKVVDLEEARGLYNGGWTLLGDEQGPELLPFWPEKAFAELCAAAQWAGYVV